MVLPDLYLMRHGETRWNAEARFQGQLDSPLTARGQQQARWQAELIAGVAGRRLSSPQGRAVETARLVFGPGGFETRADLAEIGMGPFAGQRQDRLRGDHPAVFRGQGLDWYDRIPGGEGFAALAGRCRCLLTSLDGPALIVSHGITLRMIWVLAMGRNVTELAGAPVDQGRVLIIRRGTSDVRRHPDDRD
ncbi:MAG: histidine phosphatase family protein [Paracoccus sp. (in: a-proteobacteria)]|uniref:histidine phosphatase family protein n=1 Tax=Paracoccus sp. TaxID=267 RepID=UPI003919369D